MTLFPPTRVTFPARNLRCVRKDWLASGGRKPLRVKRCYPRLESLPTPENAPRFPLAHCPRLSCTLVVYSRGLSVEQFVPLTKGGRGEGESSDVLMGEG